MGENILKCVKLHIMNKTVLFQLLVMTMQLVFESPVRSGFFDPKGGNRGPNRLYLINITMQPKTGLV